MRGRGQIDRIPDFGVSDHVCWNYASDLEFTEAALRWVTCGVRLGQRVLYIADRTRNRMLVDLAPLGALGRDLLDRGALVVTPMRDVYVNRGPVDPEAQVAAYEVITNEALADGYSGLCVVAEVTSLVADPTWRDEQVRWEQLADHYIARHPVSALCAYDQRVVAPETSAPITCVHPLRHDRTSAVTFSLFSTEDGLCLDGDANAFQAQLLDAALAGRVDPDDLHLEISPDAYVDVRAASVIVRHATEIARAGGEPVITNASASFGRMWEVLGYDHVVPLRDVGAVA